MKVHVDRRELDVVISELGDRQHGIVVGEQLRRRGASHEQVRHRRGGRLVLLKPDIYRLRDHPWTWDAQLQAALFDAGPSAVLSHRTAAQLHGFWRYRSHNAVEVLGPERQDHRVTLGRLHRSADIPRAHRTVVRGFPVTTVARTCFDLFGDPDPRLRRTADGRALHGVLMRRVFNDALARRGLTLGQLAAVLAAVGKRGRRGTALTRELLASVPDDYVPPESDGESLVMELVEAIGVPEPERQVVMSDEQGWIGNVDFLWRPQRFILEMDSQWHDGPIDQQQDAARDERLTVLGFTVARWRYRDVVRRPTHFANELRCAVGALGTTAHQHSLPPTAS